MDTRMLPATTTKTLVSTADAVGLVTTLLDRFDTSITIRRGTAGPEIGMDVPETTSTAREVMGLLLDDYDLDNVSLAKAGDGRVVSADGLQISIYRSP